MSEIHLIIIKDRKICFIKEHYRKIKQLLENPESIKLKDSEYLDAGYILLDLNNKEIIDCQDAI